MSGVTRRRSPATTALRRVATRSRAGEHGTAQKAARKVGVAVLTVSDTRRGERDTSGALAEQLLTAAGHTVTSRAWVRDDIRAIRAALRLVLARRDTDAVVLTGGTGIAKRDVTPEAVEPLLDVTLPGFGERFRAASWASVGPAAWLSRAGAGVAQGRLVVYLPGSSGAVRDGLERLVIPELVHAVRLLGRV
jgi:molybdenum cofactor biosynthesis protein B